MQNIKKWTLRSFLHCTSFIVINWLVLFIFSTDSPSFLHAIELVLIESQSLPTATKPCHHVLKFIWDYISPRGWMCTIEYNGTQTLAIRPSYVCTQDPTECPIPLQWTSIHPFIELPVIKYKIQIQISNTKYQYND